jgi:UDP-N-acetylmuramyl pentapeptide phosphotransferase/UDP-N-acetylglucosamine-1-phosphate transferase
MEEELMFKYEQLRKEILQNHTLTLQVMGGVLVIASALVTYILTKEYISTQLKAFLFLLLGVVASLGLLQDIYPVGSTYVIASYIKNFIEPNMNVK